MLLEFDKALDRFVREVHEQLREHMFDHSVRVDDFRMQADALAMAEDVRYLALTLRDLHVQAIDEVSRNFNEKKRRDEAHLKAYLVRKGPGASLDKEFFDTQPQDRIWSVEGIAKFAATYKGFLFVVRAFQDTLYRVGMRIFDQGVNADTSSMADAIDPEARDFKKNQPVGAIIRAECPEFAQWFLGLRAWRNAVKGGKGVSYSSGGNFLTNQITIAFKIYGRKGHEDAVELSLDDVRKALEATTGATVAIIRIGIARGALR